MPGAITYRGPELTVRHENYAEQARIDDRAPVRGQHRIELAAPVDQVWKMLVDAPPWGRTLEPGVHGLRVPEGAAVDAPFTRTNRGARMTARFAVIAPESELSWTGSAFGARAVHRLTLEALADGGTRVTAESMAGPLLGLIFGRRQLQTTLERSLAQLAPALRERAAT